MHRVTRTLSYLLALAACGAAVMPLRAGQPAQSAPASSTAALNYEYFKTKVQPIFLARRPGHARCVACHASNNSPLHLEPLLPGTASWSEDESRKNFESVKKVVSPGNLKSPLLIHPLDEKAGGDFFHGGGKHFSSQSNPEWQTLKAWVMGATSK